MDYNFDALRNPILERLGFAAIYGLTVAELFDFARELYVKIEGAKSDANGEHPPVAQSQTQLNHSVDISHQPGDDESLAGLQASPNDSSPAPLATYAHVVSETEEWKTKLWEYLTALPNFVVGPEGESNQLSLVQIEALPLPVLDEIPPDSDSDENEDGERVARTRSRRKKKPASSLKQKKNPPSPPEESSDAIETIYQPRVFTSRKKIWRTITGHTIDTDRVPLAEFETLCAISQAGKDGIDQISLIRLTGQDKKSLPKRTYALETKGYIEKRPIVLPKANTSLLTHKKFVDDAIANGTHYSLRIVQPISTTNLDPVPGYEFWNGNLIFEDALVRRMIDLFETWGAMVYDHVRVKMGIGERPWNMKVLAKRIRILCGLGVIEKGNFAMVGSDKIYKGAIKFLRQPNDAEWKGLMRRSTRELKTEEEAAMSHEASPAKSKGKSRRQAHNKGSDGNSESGEDNDEHSVQSYETLQDIDKEAVNGGSGYAPSFEDRAISNDELPRADGDIHHAEQRAALTVNGVDMPDYSSTIGMETYSTSTGHVIINGESSKPSRPVSSITAADYAEHLRPLVQGSSTEPHGTSQTYVPSSQVLPTAMPAVPPKVPKKLGRPPGRKDSTPRVKKANARPDRKSPTPRAAATEQQEMNQTPVPSDQVPPEGSSNEHQEMNQTSMPSDQVPPAAPSADPPKPVKRRGRPPKLKDATPQAVSTEQQEINQTPTSSDQVPPTIGPTDLPKPVKRKGRPPGRKDGTPRGKKADTGIVQGDSSSQAEPSEVVRAPRGRRIKNAIFTSYEDLQREEGVAGVYINPDGSHYSTRKKDVMVAVFKTSLLKTWVPNPVNTAVNSQNISDASLGGQNNAFMNSSVPEKPTQLPRSNSSATIPASGAPGADPSPFFAALVPSNEMVDGNATSTIESARPSATIDSPFPHPTTASPALSSNTIVSEIDKVEKALQIASGLQLPEDTGFISAIWNDLPGKLGLAEDKKNVVFFSADVTLPTDPVLMVETSTISEYPTVSKSAPISGEFLIKANDQSYAFTISKADEAFIAANILRAKIVTVLLGQGIQENKTTPQVSASGDSDKPFQCEHCLQRWKNDNGLLYHQTKSRTTCNPNWDPSEPPKPSGRVAQKLTTATAEVLGSRRSETYANSVSREPSQAVDTRVGQDDGQSTPLDDDLGNLLGQDLKRKAREISSDDSDFVPDKIDKRTPKKRKVMALNGSVSSKASRKANFNTDLDADMDVDTDADSLIGQVVKKKKPRRSKAKGAPVPNSLPALKALIFELIESNGGVFPGDHRSLWDVVAGETRKRWPNIEYPEFSKIPAALRSLLDGKRLKRFTSSFKSASGLMANISVIVKASLATDTDAIEQMKTQIKNAHPDRYIPASLKPSDSIIAELDELERGYAERKSQVGVLSNPYYLNKAVKEDSAPVYSSHGIAKAYSTQNDDGSDFEMEDMATIGTPGSDFVEEQSGVARQNGELNGEEDEGEDSTAETPDPDRSQASSITNIPKTKQKKNKTYTRKPRLPEVITYMQSEGDPTWSSQPYGHGARPIYSRPGRRVEGNPATDIRLRRLQDGHRPVIEPRQKMIAPARPSKLLSHPYISTHDQFVENAKRQKLNIKGGYRGRGSNTQPRGRSASVYEPHFPHQRPVGMKPLPVIVPPALSQSDHTVTFLPPNTDLGDKLLDEAARSIKDNSPITGLDSRQTPSAFISGSGIAFTHIQTIHKLQGQYHDVPGATFEKSSCSYSLKEPVVPRAFILDQLLPKSLQEIVPAKKKALKQAEKASNSEYATFSEQIEAVKNWELANESLLGQGHVASEINNGINHTMKVLKYSKRPYSVRIDWNAGEALTWFNPPWESEDDYLSEEERAQNIPPRRPPGRPPRTIIPTKTQIRHFKERKLTHLPTDFETGDDRTDVPIFNLVQPPTGKKGQKLVMSAEEEIRFIITHITIYTLAGGLKKSLDSILVARMFPKYTLSKTRQLWCKIRKARGKEIPIIEARFQEAFLKGYEDGELPAINYDDLLNYDWAYVVKWYMEKHPVVSGALQGGLPSTRSALFANYEVEDMQATINWRDRFLVKDPISRIDRHRAAAEDQLTIPLHSKRSSDVSPTEAEVAKSVVRAAIATPSETYNQYVASAKLEKIGNEAVTVAKDELYNGGWIKHKNRGRGVPRQPFMITEAFTKPLVKESIKLSCFPEALEYKQQLDAKFRDSNKCVKISLKETDGAFMCLTNLLAHDRIRLKQSGVPMDPGGLLINGGYETNAIDKSKLIFALEIEKTDSYIYHDEFLASIAGKLDPPGALGDAVPAWRDINGDLLPDIWTKIQKGMFSALAMRAGTNVEELKRVSNDSLMDWEIQLFLEWGMENGAVEQIGRGYEGWTAGEWWWMFPAL